MNERIKLLAEQATETFTSYFDGRGNVTETYFDKEKFAALIIRECGIVGDDWVDNEDNGKNRISDKFRQHFGVKEL